MARKHKCPPVGAPAWVLTYGDMMSLLLCFFVLLASLANFDKRDKLFMAAMESIQRAFGATGQSGYYPENIVDFKSFLMRLQSAAVPDLNKNYGHSEEPGMDGRYYRVRKIRDGVEITIGGPIAFGRFSADLEQPMREILDQLIEEVKGKTNKLEIRGHATNEPLPPDSPYRDQFDLGFARSRAVADYLVERGIDPRALRMSSAGSYEPLKQNVYLDERRAVNRRVEIVVMPVLITDYMPKPEASVAAPVTGSATPPPAG